MVSRASASVAKLRHQMHLASRHRLDCHQVSTTGALLAAPRARPGMRACVVTLRTAGPDYGLPRIGPSITQNAAELHALEWTRTTTGKSPHKALNLVHDRKIAPSASRSSKLLAFADASDSRRNRLASGRRTPNDMTRRFSFGSGGPAIAWLPITRGMKSRCKGAIPRRPRVLPNHP